MGVPAPNRARALLALALIVPAASLGSWLAFGLAPGPVGQAVYALTRLWMLALPVLWLLRIERGRPSLSPVPRELRREALAAAVVLSAVCGLAIYGVWVLLGSRLVEAETLRSTLVAAGLGTPLRFALAGSYIAFVNSLVEEYVWRWFVFRRCEDASGGAWAVPLSALCFTAHHVVAFGLQMGLQAGLLASLGVFLAGCLWSLSYLRYRSIWPAWPSHVVADVVGLAIAWRILFA